MHRKIQIPPLYLPIVFFASAILAGTCLLVFPFATHEGGISLVDALFTATSATCVTGLSVLDTGRDFTVFGQGVILFLIQAGGLGIMTLTSLLFFLWQRSISLTDRIAVGQSLLHDPSYPLGPILTGIVVFTFFAEAFGAFLLHLADPFGFPPYSAVFHSVSAFCNAGFSLHSDSLTRWQGDIFVNIVFMVLIIAGGLGFTVILEMLQYCRKRFIQKDKTIRLSWYALVVLRTTVFMVIFGWAAIFAFQSCAEGASGFSGKKILSALFQSVTCRTAGFNTMDIGSLPNITLLFMMLLMFVGAASGSCAGGIKVSTFRVLMGFIVSQIKGRDQTVVGKFAVSPETVNRALLLVVFSISILFLFNALLNLTELHGSLHPKGMFLDILFEVVSALGTVGLSTGLTGKLSQAGKICVILLMFIGRLGPILFVSVIREYRTPELFLRPEEAMMIG